MLKVLGTVCGLTDIKRCFFPGLTFELTCPRCNTANIRDMNEEYIDYPIVGKPTVYPCWCPECEYEWLEVIQINITVQSIGVKDETT